MSACPTCSSVNICGHEVRGIYDGVLFWRCQDCGLAFQRWSPESHRFPIAQQFIDRCNGVAA